MAADITSFSTIYQSYQDDERLLLNGCMQMEPHLRLKKKVPPPTGIKLETTELLVLFHSEERGI